MGHVIQLLYCAGVHCPVPDFQASQRLSYRPRRSVRHNGNDQGNQHVTGKPAWPWGGLPNGADGCDSWHSCRPDLLQIQAQSNRWDRLCLGVYRSLGRLPPQHVYFVQYRTVLRPCILVRHLPLEPSTAHSPIEPIACPTRTSLLQL